MGASEQVTGPVAVWVGVPILFPKVEKVPTGDSRGSVNQVSLQTTIAPVFFGWGESAPDPEFLPEYENLMSDLGGTRKPWDKIFEGADARVSITSTIWDEDVLQSCMSYTKTSLPGVVGNYDVGTLMHAEKRSYQLWLVYPYQVKPFMAAANMRKGYHFYGAMIEGPVRRKQGTGGNKVSLSWYCGIPRINGIGACYDFDMSAVLNKPTPLNQR